MPERFHATSYIAWLRNRQDNKDSCLFATAPDVVGDAAATLARAKPVLPMIREVGYLAALVAQDGLEVSNTPWDTFDCLFIGGTTTWKLSTTACDFMEEANARGKWVHVGRVNSYKRLKWCVDHGAQSADGTFVAFGPDKNIPRLERWLLKLALEREKVAPRDS